MLLYLNTNVYCRPFDDLEQERILKEAVAASKIFLWGKSQLVSILGSEIILSEIFLIENMYKRDAVEHLLSSVRSRSVKIASGNINCADRFASLKILNDYMDILHLVLAAQNNAEYFLTCDDEIIIKSSLIEKFFKEEKLSLKIKNPLEFVKTLEVNFL